MSNYLKNLDYAVHIFHDVIKTGKYECFLKEDSRLPMIYLPDCIRATVECLEAPSEALKMRLVAIITVELHNVQTLHPESGERRRVWLARLLGFPEI